MSFKEENKDRKKVSREVNDYGMVVPVSVFRINSSAERWLYRRNGNITIVVTDTTFNQPR